MHTPVAHRAGPREWTGLAILALPTALLGLDLSVLYLALPALTADLQPTATQMLWIMDAYGFLLGGVLITMGTLGDRIGRRKLLMIGAACFGAVSLVAAFATSAEMLIAARAVLGIAGATLMPSTLSLISNMFTDARQRAVAIGIWATTFALGMAAGPLVGGVLLDHFWWGSAFLIAIPVVGVLLVIGPLVLPEYRAPGRGRLDLGSVALSLAAILPLIYVVKHTAKAGVDLTGAVSLVVGIGFAVVFVRRQRKLDDPLLDMSLFTSRTFNAAVGVLLFGLIGVGGVMFLVTQYLQLVEGLAPFEAGLWMGPPALMMFLASLTSPLIARRVRPGTIVAVTLVLAAAGHFMLSFAGPGNTGLVVSGFGLVYLGLGTIAALGTDLVVGSAPPEKSGSAAAISETVQDMGIAIGVAVLGSLTSVVYRSQLPELPSEFAGAEDGLAGAVAVLPGDLLRQAQEAFTAGLNVAALVTGIGVLVLAAVAATSLRHIGTIGDDGYDER